MRDEVECQDSCKQGYYVINYTNVCCLEDYVYFCSIINSMIA